MKGTKFVGVILGLTWRRDSGWKCGLSDSSGEQRERASFTIRQTIAFGSSSASATTFSISISLSPSLWVFLLSRHWRWIKLSWWRLGSPSILDWICMGVFTYRKGPGHELTIWLPSHAMGRYVMIRLLRGTGQHVELASSWRFPFLPASEYSNFKNMVLSTKSNPSTELM